MKEYEKKRSETNSFGQPARGSFRKEKAETYVGLGRWTLMNISKENLLTGI